MSLSVRLRKFATAPIIAILGIVVLAAIFFGQSVTRQLAVDRCLDSGGCWDETDQVCRKIEDNAQALCDRSSEREL